MRTSDLIPITAMRPAEFRPLSLDADRWLAEQTKQIEIDKQQAPALDATSPTLDADQAARDAVYKARYDEVRETADRIRAQYPKPPTFLIVVPTAIERDQINSRMASLGLLQVSQEVVRATMIDELFEMFDEAEAEEKANFLDGVWQREEAHDAAINAWQEQEVERVLDEHAGAPARPRAEQPPKIISVRENARMQILAAKMMSESQRLRDLIARNLDFDRRHTHNLLRCHILPDVQNLILPEPIQYDPRTRTISEAAVDMIREALPVEAWNELVRHVDGLYRLTKAEEKNFGSPLGNTTPPSGLTEQSDDTAISGGPSTTSSTDPVLDDGSAKIIDRSSASTTEAEAQSKSASPMAEA